MAFQEDHLVRLVREELAENAGALTDFFTLLPDKSRDLVYEWFRGSEPLAEEFRDTLEKALIWHPGTVAKLLTMGPDERILLHQVREWGFVEPPVADSAGDLPTSVLLFEMRRRLRSCSKS